MGCTPFTNSVQLVKYQEVCYENSFDRLHDVLTVTLAALLGMVMGGLFGLVAAKLPPELFTARPKTVLFFNIHWPLRTAIVVLG